MISLKSLSRVALHVWLLGLCLLAIFSEQPGEGDIVTILQLLPIACYFCVMSIQSIEISTTKQEPKNETD